ncbi:type I restriction-modification system, S subunit [Mycoplasmopsis columboralis]|uniref:Type I restriction-modification system, S subunit n=1 Tax=Mycoplasmopsis columboralis TaxID=171282 RepID=A0A449B5I9_9BACT|nr:type I restriction-modification system, S subunit [Mycoplasmopsis columboralis]
MKDKETLRTKYLYYFLKNNINTIASFYRGSGIKHPNMSDILEMEIMIPSIQEQDRIIEILDKFTTFSAELKAELKARKEQYTYYRNYLLSEEKLNYIYQLKDLVEFRKDETSKIAPEGHLYPVVSGGETSKQKTDIYNREENFITISSSGANAGIVNFWSTKIFAKDCFSLEAKSNLLNQKYLYYWLKSNQEEIYKLKSLGTIPRVYAKDVENLKIQLPSIKIQNKIVDVLDNFEKICQDINVGLPSELNLREQQYAYYRDKLLSFAQGNLEVSPERERLARSS